MDYQSIMKELLNPTHRPNRSGKDLSARKCFTAKAGELLPILCEELVPNDYVKLDTASLIRTFPLQTAAFLRARVHFDFFFVPKTAIWRNWNRFFYQRDDRESSLMNGFAYEPNIKIRDLFNVATYQASSGVRDSYASRCKLAQLLGYGDLASTNVYYNATSPSPQYTVGQKSLSILPMLGYQRIYNMWYRNAWRDEPSALDTWQYSADAWLCDTYANSLFDSQYPVGAGGADSPLKMRYHGWFSDLFMGSLPNQQFGSVSTIDVSGSASLTGTTGVDTGRWSTRNGSWLQNEQVVTPGNNDHSLAAGTSDFLLHDHTFSFSAAGTLGTFDVLALRKALALQKWKESNMRAGWKNRNQARAMFGVSTPEDRKHEIEFIKGYDFPVMIDEVVSQNGATAGNLGEIAGKGIGVGNGELLEFNPGERHGYLYCIAYVLPQVEYDAIGIEKYLVRSEPFDHFVPAFENLGMEPIYKYELNADGDPNYFDSVIGYAPRYHEYKTRLDKVYGEFMSNNTLSSWVSVRRDLQNIANLGSIPTSYFYVNPSVLDTIFAFSADGSQATDQFILNVNFTDKMVRPMSDLGLPNL